MQYICGQCVQEASWQRRDPVGLRHSPLSVLQMANLQDDDDEYGGGGGGAYDKFVISAGKADSH